MLENLQNLVRENAGNAIINNPAIPNEKNEEAVADASSSIISGLKTAVANGNYDGVMSLFNGDSQEVASSAVSKNIQDGYAHNLMQKFGLDQGKAGQIAAALIPMVLQKFIKKTNNPQDSSFDLSSILSGLTGGAGIGDLLKNFGGNNNSEGGDMLGKIKGMFK